MTVTESSGYCSYSSTVLQRLEEVSVGDVINQLEIADGLKQLLLSKDFALKSLLNISVSELAEIIGIDEYIANIIINTIKQSTVIKNTGRKINDAMIDPIDTTTLKNIRND